MSSKENIVLQEEKIIFYSNDEATITVDVYFVDETFWLTQKAMSELFNVEANTINYHLKEIYNSEELIESSTIRKFRVVRLEGSREVKREVQFYNLDAIIAVGYRVNSKQATQFRRWATNTLTEFITKGFVINDRMLKNGKPFGKDYFDELLEKIREIRASERRAYQKIADVFEQCSSDYSPKSDETKLFYKTVQNKLHFATTGSTAAEIIYNRADSELPHMGLTTWKNAPKGKVLKGDTTIAKNYLNEKEINKLNRLVTLFIDFAELRALNNQVMTMKDWLNHINKFLAFSDQEILENAGKISHEMAVAKAHEEYDKFRVKQDKLYVSDFDRQFEKYLKGGDR
jgi:hypothetical protein